jgi:hypothetical protein
MTIEIAEHDRHLFGFLYAVIIDFADAPGMVINRVGGGRIDVADDLANSHGYYYRLASGKYPATSLLELMQLAARIDAILVSRGHGDERFDASFWTNEGFQNHPDWIEIREAARSFLMR